MKACLSLILICFLLFGQPSPISGQQNPPAPLDSAELREILIRLHQLQISWDELQLRIQAEQQMQELFNRERALAQRELDTEKQRTGLATKEAATEKERAEFYRQAYEAVTRKPGLGCALKKLVTFGLSRCG